MQDIIRSMRNVHVKSRGLSYKQVNRKRIYLMERKLFTSESVTEGHPDKVCDQISDAVLDAVLEQDPNGRVACETCCTNGLVMIMGEISTTAKVDIQDVARKTLLDIGYDSPDKGLDGNTCGVIVSMNRQSSDIALGTNDEAGGAGDQGMMFGYACRETEDLMPLPITLANRLSYRLSKIRKEVFPDILCPDGKTQVTIEYDGDGKPVKVDTVLISAQHRSEISQKDLRDLIIEHVVTPELKRAASEVEGLITSDYRMLVNPTGRFVIGGPAGDTGLTGRKIIVDTYGGYVPHGGGAFSGKDPTKVDRSAAYMARHIAKNIVSSGMAEKCQIQIAYAIGMKEPVSVMIDTFGTGNIEEDIICEYVNTNFDLTPHGIIKTLGLRKPIYKNTAAYGHFGMVRCGEKPWEDVQSVKVI